jgi:hypothetical protein
MSSLSSSQFGDEVIPAGVEEHADVPTPLSLSANTTGSVAARTAWRSNDRGSSPAAYSSKTRGTTLNWDDAQPTQVPTSDKGASFGGK